MNFIRACAQLYANINGVSYTASDLTDAVLTQVLSQTTVPQFIPSSKVYFLHLTFFFLQKNIDKTFQVYFSKIDKSDLLRSEHGRVMDKIIKKNNSAVHFLLYTCIASEIVQVNSIESM